MGDFRRRKGQRIWKESLKEEISSGKEERMKRIEG